MINVISLLVNHWYLAYHIHSVSPFPFICQLELYSCADTLSTGTCKSNFFIFSRGTCIVGLCMDIVSTIAIVEELMLPKVHGFNYFLTYRTSQDHLELFFCAVRQCGRYLSYLLFSSLMLLVKFLFWEILLICCNLWFCRWIFKQPHSRIVHKHLQATSGPYRPFAWIRGSKCEETRWHSPIGWYNINLCSSAWHQCCWDHPGRT